MSAPGPGEAPAIDGLRFVRPLGSGGQAGVFLAEQDVPRRMVAVKLLTGPVGDGRAERFLAEADVLARLEHPHVVPVYSAGRAADGRPYLVMRYCPPPTLADLGGLATADVLRVGVQLAGAVATVHAAGLLHLDVKPANVLISRDGVPVLADFGLAGPPLGEAAGASVPWAAPELLFGTAAPGERTDVYGLAATLWTLLSGRPPFEVPGGDNALTATMLRVRDDAPAPLGPDVDAALEDVLRAALAKDPADRPSALDLAAALQEIEEELGLPRTELVVFAGRPRASDEAGERPAADPQSGAVASAEGAGEGSRASRPSGSAAGGPRRRRLPLGVAVGIALALIPVGLVLSVWLKPAASTIAVSGRRAGDVVAFTWTDSAGQPAGGYRAEVNERALDLDRPPVTVRGSGKVCVSVQRLDGDKRPQGTASATTCVP
ncbi:serine/threonine-protein kinase [Nigerium massiliense]|uniref:serine/threonine-protein kinase n=1 Tax=Nigerium massiliense TaxID=1522317 RepID=UPI000693985C|nr:serine/threonine-protein kinase [Nigerium massiliense]